jgi:hypothetical protein
VYHHRTGRRFDLSMREVFADTVAELLPGNPLDRLEEYLRLNDWALLDAVQRWQTDAAGTARRRLADAWERILARDLRWHLAYDTIAHGDVDTSSLHERILAALPTGAPRARIEVDVAAARVAPHNPMTEHGFVNIYDPLQGTVEAARIDQLVSRLPQYSQVVRIFVDDAAAVPAIHAAARAVLQD